MWANFPNFDFSNSSKVFSKSIHFHLNFIRSWDKNIKFFLTARFLKSFDLINKNKLKNIFKKALIDNTFWSEIEKMIKVGIIDFSSKAIYTSKNIFSNSLLSTFLFNIYLIEFEFFIFQIALKYNLRKIIKKKFFLSQNKNFSLYKKNFIEYSPINLENKLMKFKNIRFLYVDKYNKFKRFFFEKRNFLVPFTKHIYYARYIDHFIFGFISSKIFVFSIQKKLVSFIRSNLHFDVKDLTLSSINDNSIIFCGFNIRLVSTKIKNLLLLSKLKINKKYLSKISARILRNQKRVAKNFVFRFQTEILAHINHILEKKALKSLSLKDNKLWTYIFQIEAIRAAHLDKLIATKDKVNLISGELFSTIKFSRVNKYQKYSFDLYIFKLQTILKEVIQVFPSYISNSVLSTDLALSISITEFRKRLLFFYNNFFFNFKKTLYSEFSVNSMLSKYSFSLFNINYFNKNVFYIKKSFSSVNEYFFEETFFFEVLLLLTFVFKNYESLVFCIHKRIVLLVIQNSYYFMIISLLSLLVILLIFF